MGFTTTFYISFKNSTTFHHEVKPVDNSLENVDNLKCFGLVTKK